MNGKENSKRPREPNWSEEEKELFRELVRGHLSVVDDKRNDVKMIATKKASWLDIQLNMEAAGFCRCTQKLKEQWHRMKLASRRSISNMRAAQRATGNTVIVKEPTQEDLMIKDMMTEDYLEDTILIDSNTAETGDPGDDVEYLNEDPVEVVLQQRPTNFQIMSGNEEEDEDEMANPVKKLKSLPKPVRKPAVDVLTQRRKQISTEERQSRELHQLRVQLMKKKIKHEDSLYLLERETKEVMLETAILQRDKEKARV